MDKALADAQWFNSPYLVGKGITPDQVAHIEQIGEWYDKEQSVIDNRTIRIWHNLSIESYNQALRLLEKHNVYAEPVSGQPYQNQEEMFQDIREGILQISIDNVDHPLMNQYDIFYGRVWHDLAHFECQSGFGFTGELHAYNKQWDHVEHYSVFTQAARAEISHALYIDVVGQTCSGLIHKQFPIQKVF